MPLPYRTPPIQVPWQPQPLHRPSPELLVAPFTTTFPLTESPISQGGLWIQGKTNGVDWHDVVTTTGEAYGTQSGTDSSLFNDSIAVLRGSFGPDQRSQATVVNTLTGSASYTAEVELLLRFTINGHDAHGYEINFSCNSSSQYTEIVRWNGAQGSFTSLSHINGIFVQNGDVVTATIVGGTITSYINGVQVNTATDSTYTTGSPGMGFWLDNGAGGSGTGTNVGHGFSSFSTQPVLSMGDPENYGRPFGHQGQAQVQQLLAI